MNTFTQRPKGRAARKDATRGRLLAEARHAFVRQGYEATTIRGVAAAAGVAVGTVFVHFPDKSALLAATLDDHLQQVLGRALDTLPPGGARQKVGHVLKALFAGYARQPALSRVLLRETLFAQGDQREAAQAGVEAFVAQLEGWCREPGNLRPGLDPHDAAEAIFAAYLAALLEGLAQPRPRVETMWQRVERLIAPWFKPTNGGRS